MSVSYEQIKSAVSYMRSRLGDTPAPEVALILGSGMGPIADRVEDAVVISYNDVPHINPSTVAWHKGCFVVGKLGGKQVICMQGRLHGYEGNTAEQIVMPVYVMAELGATKLIVTNASGGINTSYEAGDIVAVTDHINFMGMNPLAGTHDPELPIPFIDMTMCYSKRILKLIQEAAQELDIYVPEGVYLADLGPSFETPAEIRAFRAWGADLVGMSTVPEVLVGRQMGMEIGVLSLVTNMAAGVLDQPISPKDVPETAAYKGQVMSNLVCRLLEKL